MVEAYLGNLDESVMETVRSFLREHVADFSELAVLLLLRGERDRAWSAAEVSERLDTVPEFAQMALQSLCGHGLLRSSSSAGTARFQFAPETQELAQAVDALAQAHEERRWLVIQAMNENSMARLREAASQAFASRRRRP